MNKIKQISEDQFNRALRLGLPKSTQEEYEIRQFFDSLPDAPQWISVSERLPEKNGVYLTTIENVCMGGCTYFVSMTRFTLIPHQRFETSLAVIAWMPLPEPYKEEE